MAHKSLTLPSWLEQTHFEIEAKGIAVESERITIIYNILTFLESYLHCKIYTKVIDKKIICECHVNVRFLKFVINLYYTSSMPTLREYTERKEKAERKEYTGGTEKKDTSNVFIVEFRKKSKGSAFGFQQIYDYIKGKYIISQYEMKEASGNILIDEISSLDPPSKEEIAELWLNFINTVQSVGKFNDNRELSDLFETWAVKAKTAEIPDNLIHSTIECIEKIISNLNSDKQTIFACLSLFETLLIGGIDPPKPLECYIKIWSKSGKIWLSDKCERLLRFY